VADIGGQVYAAHRGIGAIAAIVSGSDLQKLAELPEVAHLSVDAVITGQQVLDSALTPGQILYGTLGLTQGGGIDTGGSSYAGDKITVAVVDSGIEVSKDIEASRFKAFYDFTRGGIAAKPSDGHGHGTHVAGLIGGSGDLSSDKHEGIASKVSFVGYKVLDGTGAGYTSDAISAIEHATANKERLRIDVMNLSLGHPIFEPAGSDPLVQAVDRAVAAGIVVVVSAGNAGKNPVTGEIGYAGITSPGNTPSAITSGAVDINNSIFRGDDTVPDYSSRGPTWYDAFLKPDIVAPGRRVVAIGAGKSALYQQHPEFRVNGYNCQLNPKGQYLRLSGTSMAAAVTSGVVALTLEANRAKDDKYSIAPNAVKAILQFTAIDMGLDDLTQGAGSLNAKGAVRLAEAIDARVTSGERWVLKDAGAPFDVVAGQIVNWSQRVIWGDRLVWGDTIHTGRTSEVRCRMSSPSTPAEDGLRATNHTCVARWGPSQDTGELMTRSILKRRASWSRSAIQLKPL
jgi:serine protease AprX